MTAVVIVEPQRMTRRGIEQVISQGADLRILASVSTIDDLGSHRADVFVITSWSCPGSSDSLIAELARRGAVVVISSSSSTADLLPSLRAGASGYVTPDAGDAELVAAIRAVARGACYLMGGLAPNLCEELERRPLDAGRAGLSRREVETLGLVAQGYTHSQVARRMGLSEATVNTYVKRIRTKLNVGNKADLTRKAIDLGCLPPESDASTAPVDTGHRPHLAAVR